MMSSRDVTGWAQVNGRNAISCGSRSLLSIRSMWTSSLAMDLRILYLTAFKVFRRDGVSAADHVTMPEFRGQAEQDRLAA